ncbi:molybdenum cofactor guanylyltransferase [Halomonas urumqiensis]|nr:molybdenum cofactor guanylyltransferase [Halomonas urumqiensis]
MGGRDKGLEPFNGRPLVAHVRERLEGRVAEVLVSANRHHDDYLALADRVVSDTESGYHGPLMGIYSGLRASHTAWLLVVPCDSPALPWSLVERLMGGLAGGDIAVAHDGERLHPVVALIRVALADDLARAMAGGERKIDRWYARHDCREVDFSDCPEAFANLNTDADKRHLEQLLGKGAASS